MHLHDALRLWRAEIIGGSPLLALAEEDARSLPAEVLAGLPRESLPGGLRRDDRSSVQAVLAPASHEPARPASMDALDELEARLGFELPRGVELLHRLHDGGDFFRPAIEGLPAPLDGALHLFSTTEMIAAYGEMLAGMRTALERLDPDDDQLFRLARRFGAPKEEAGVLGDQFGRIHGGWDRGLEVIPLARPAGSQDLITFVPRAGKEGRVGLAYAVSGFLPEHSDEYPFEGLEGWLEALVKARGCRRITLQ